MDPNKMTDDDWKKKLSPEQFHVLREKGTEAPFTGKLVNNHASGMYHCAACGVPLFSSDAKFDSGTGWPSFDKDLLRSSSGKIITLARRTLPFSDEKGKPENLESSVELRPDNSMGMHRTEVVCKRCGSHLGHLFDDGPTQTGQRYCINSCALDFKSK